MGILAIVVLSTMVSAADDTPKELYYLSGTVNIAKVQPDVDKDDLTNLEDARKEYFRSGKTCAQAKKYETPKDLENFYGDLLNSMHLCAEKRAAVVDLVKHVTDDLAIQLQPLKKQFHRERPFKKHDDEVQRAGQPCAHSADENPDASFPSSHAAVAQAQGMVLAQIFKRHAEEFNARAKEIGLSRNVLGVHYPSDVKGGQDLAELVVDALQERECSTAHCFKTDMSHIAGMNCTVKPEQGTSTGGP